MSNKSNQSNDNDHDHGSHEYEFKHLLPEHTNENITNNYYHAHHTTSSSVDKETNTIDSSKNNSTNVYQKPNILALLSNFSGAMSSEKQHQQHQIDEQKKQMKPSQSQQPLIYRPRHIPIKIEPKVFFANERNFLHWLHMSAILASMSLAIITYADDNEKYFGYTLLPVSVGFSFYALRQFLIRDYHLKRREPGPYEETTGPIVLAIVLGLSIIVNFFIKLYHMTK